MTLTSRDRRALLLLGIAAAAMLVYRWSTGAGSPTVSRPAAASESIPLAERRLERIRRLAAQAPAREEVLKQASAELAEREKGLLSADTAAQAQAALLQIVRRIGKEDGVDVRGGEFGPVRPLGDQYGEVQVAVNFECQIEKLVNFLTSLSAQPEILASSEVRVVSANPKEKTVGVRLALTGVVPRKLAPVKKGAELF